MSKTLTLKLFKSPVILRLWKKSKNNIYCTFIFTICNQKIKFPSIATTKWNKKEEKIKCRKFHKFITFGLKYGKIILLRMKNINKLMIKAVQYFV